jgi:hypothetical protein
MLVVFVGPFGNESQLLCFDLEQAGTARGPACQQLNDEYTTVIRLPQKTTHQSKRRSGRIRQQESILRNDVRSV